MNIQIGDEYRSIQFPDVVLLVKDITPNSVYCHRLVKGQYNVERLFKKHVFISLIARKGKLVNSKRVKKRLGLK